MINAETANIVIKDIRTIQLMERNENYRERLYEAYVFLKRKQNGELTEQESKLSIGAFNQYEITIFDRISDKDYLNAISIGLFTITNRLEEWIKNKHIGDDLASWGTLGSTPKRDELIDKGYIVFGITEEDRKRRSL